MTPFRRKRKDPMPDHHLDATLLTTDELAAVVRNDTETYADAGKVIVPEALAELERRAEVDDHAGDYAKATLIELKDEAERAVAELKDEADLEPEVLQPREDATPIADVLRARGADQAADDLERAADVQSRGTQAANGSVEDVLRSNGFVAIRQAIYGIVSAADGIGPGAIDAALAYGTTKRREAEAAGQPRNVLDAIDAELAAFKAVRRFVSELKAATERAKARAAITGGL